MKQTIARLFAAVLFAIAARFDRGLEGIIGQLVVLDEKLDAFAAKQDAKLGAIRAAKSASIARASAFAGKEQAFRAKAQSRAVDIASAQERAARIRERIAKLID